MTDDARVARIERQLSSVKRTLLLVFFMFLGAVAVGVLNVRSIRANNAQLVQAHGRLVASHNRLITEWNKQNSGATGLLRALDVPGASIIGGIIDGR